MNCLCSFPVKIISDITAMTAYYRMSRKSCPIIIEYLLDMKFLSVAQVVESHYVGSHWLASFLFHALETRHMGQ